MSIVVVSPARSCVCARRQLEVEAFGHIVFDEECRLANRRAFRIDIGLHAPRAARARRQQRQRIAAAARALIRDQHALIFDAVRPTGDERQRQTLFGDALVIAQQRRDIDRFARAIDAALSEDLRIERLRYVAALDAAIRQIERALLKIEKAVIALAVLGDDEARRQSAAAARQARLEAHIAARIARLGRQNLVVTRDEAQRDAAERLRGGQRANEDMQSVAARKRGEAEIRDDEPLRRDIAVILDPPPAMHRPAWRS